MLLTKSSFILFIAIVLIIVINVIIVIVVVIISFIMVVAMRWSALILFELFIIHRHLDSWNPRHKVVQPQQHGWAVVVLVMFIVVVIVMVVVGSHWG